MLLLAASVATAAWLAQRYHWQLDLTAAARNSLTAPSQALLARLDGPLEVTAYARPEGVLRKAILQFVERYRREKPDLELRFVDPDRSPQEVRRLRITVDGELVLAYRGRTAHVQGLTEQSFSNALHKIARDDTRWITYLTGHGERDLLGNANHDLGRWGRSLAARGFKLQPLNPAAVDEVPRNASVLVVSQSTTELPPHAIEVVRAYVEAGGNLLWLADPGDQRGMEAIGAALGLRFEPGVVVDPAGDPTGFAVVSAYSSHPVTERFARNTIYPLAAGIAWERPDGWSTTGLLSTGLRTWQETGPLDASVQFEAGSDVAGPLDLAIAMQRPLPNGSAAREGGETLEQRVVVFGDGDFLSNAYVGRAGNLELGLNVINWLSRDDALLDVPPRTAVDVAFDPSPAARAIIALGPPLGVPLLLLATGLYVWNSRRRR